MIITSFIKRCCAVHLYRYTCRAILNQHTYSIIQDYCFRIVNFTFQILIFHLQESQLEDIIATVSSFLIPIDLILIFIKNYGLKLNIMF